MYCSALPCVKEMLPVPLMRLQPDNRKPNYQGPFLTSGSRDKQIKICNEGVEELCLVKLVGINNWVHQLMVHPDGKYFRFLMIKYCASQ